jgi:hypothetical protein
MAAESGTGLFGTLPEQMSAARPKGAPRLRQAERRQVSLRPISLEDLLPGDHRARFVWSFAERLDLSALRIPRDRGRGFHGIVGVKSTGRRAAIPRDRGHLGSGA